MRREQYKIQSRRCFAEDVEDIPWSAPSFDDDLFRYPEHLPDHRYHNKITHENISPYNIIGIDQSESDDFRLPVDAPNSAIPDLHISHLHTSTHSIVEGGDYYPPQLSVWPVPPTHLNVEGGD